MRHRSRRSGYDRDRETERQRDRESERQRDRETERQRDRETERPVYLCGDDQEEVGRAPKSSGRLNRRQVGD